MLSGPARGYTSDNLGAPCYRVLGIGSGLEFIIVLVSVKGEETERREGTETR